MRIRRRAALALNDRANRLLDESRYEEACDLYAEASKLTPGDAVIHSNLSNAAALLYRPGRRGETLAVAIAKAIEINPDADYVERLARLDFEARLVDAVGEPQVFGDAVPRVLAIELASNLLPLILVPGEQTLTAETLALIDRLRTRMRDETGLLLPGVRFAEDEAAPLGRYTLYFLEHEHSFGCTVAEGHIFVGSAADLERLEIEGEALTVAVVGRDGVRARRRRRGRDRSGRARDLGPGRSTSPPSRARDREEARLGRGVTRTSL